MKKLLPIISLSLLTLGVQPEVRSDIFTFNQSSSDSTNSPSQWTIELTPGTYRFSTWGSSTDTWLQLYQGNTEVQSNDDTSNSDIYLYSEGLVDGLTSASDVGGCDADGFEFCSSILYTYESGDATHTITLSSYAQIEELSEEDAALFGGIFVTDAKLFSNFDVVGHILNSQAPPYAAMQSVGLDAINNQTSLVLDNAGECKDNGWTIDNGKYCVFAAASNGTTDIYGDSRYGSYETANFISSYGVELNHDDNWTLGLAYGNGTSNLSAYDFSNTTAHAKADNNFYSAYAVKQANENLRLSWLVGLSDHENEVNRSYAGKKATANYSSHGYAAAMAATWDKEVIGKKGRPYLFQPKLGLAYASHDQDSFSETGSGSLMTVSQNEVNSLLYKGGIDISTELVVNKGKNKFIPRLGLGYEIDADSDWDTSDSIKTKLKGSSSDPIRVKAKKIGSNKGIVNVGADYYFTERLMVNTNASIKVTGEGSESSYGGGFNWFF